MATAASSVYNFIAHTVDPPRHHPQSTRSFTEEDEEKSSDGTLKTVAPRPVSLQSFANQVLVLVMMGRNDPSTKSHLEQLQKMQDKYESRGTLVAAVNERRYPFGGEGGDTDCMLDGWVGASGFQVLIFPTNTFGDEPGSDADSLRFVRDLGHGFPVFCQVHELQGLLV